MEHISKVLERVKEQAESASVDQPINQIPPAVIDTDGSRYILRDKKTVKRTKAHKVPYVTVISQTKGN